MSEHAPKQIPESVWSGTFRLCGVDLKCHSLDDGRRIIERDSLERLMTALDSGSAIGPDDAATFAAFNAWRTGGRGGAAEAGIAIDDSPNVIPVRFPSHDRD